MGDERMGTGLQEPQQAPGPGPAATGLQESPAPDDAAARWWASQHEAYQRIWHSDRSLPERLWGVTRQSMRTRPDADENMIRAQIRLGVRPPNAGMATVDLVESSPAAAAFYGLSLAAGSDQPENWAELGGQLGGMTMAGASRFGRMPPQMGVMQPQKGETPGPVAQGLFRQGAYPDPLKVGPTPEAFEGLVQEHSKGNDVSLTPAGARAIFAETQPRWTWAHVAGDNVAGADIRYRDLNGNEVPGTGTQVKSLTGPRGFEKAVRKELKEPTGSPVLAVQVPRGMNADRLMGKLRSNFSDREVSGRSIVVVDDDGKVLVGKQPFPQQRSDGQ